MRIISLLILLFSLPLLLLGQEKNDQEEGHLPKHYFSVNPLNIIAFQQIGMTYEYKPGILGIALTGGYIYPNYASYSNWFIAGPIEYGSLGYYSGFFIVPQVNVYLNKPKNNERANLIYLSLKMVYKNMNIDTTTQAVWENRGDGYDIYRKMNDKVTIFGGFIGLGYKYVKHRFFVDVNFGVGYTLVKHEMYIVAEGYENYKYIFDPPITEELIEKQAAINFTINLGLAL